MLVGALGLFGSRGNAQAYIEGRWEGILTEYDSLGGKTEYRMELYLELENRRVSGRCFVHLAPGKAIAMEVRGNLYQDNSIYLLDQQYLGPDQDLIPPFFRKYQLLPFRSIWETTMEGFWQEIVPDDPLQKKRKLGRITLEKLDNSKA